MKVSIIIPIYNVSSYIERCLLSVVNQTYKDFECILIDDCGSDNSIAIAQEFIKKYEDIVSFIILHHDRNRGLSAARNTALLHAKGEYIYFLDSDDAITPNCIEELINLSQKYPDANFIQGNFLDKEGNISLYGWNEHLPEYCNNHDELEHYILSVVVTSACNKIIKKTFLSEHELLFPEGILHEDMYWSFFLAQHVKAVAYTNNGTYIYYINNNSITTSSTRQSIIKRYTSRLYASRAFCSSLDKGKKSTKRQRLYIAGNLTCAMMEVASLHSLKHWIVFWRHVYGIYAHHSRLNKWQHLFFFFLMPPLCFPINIKGWYWRLHHYIVNNI